MEQLIIGDVVITKTEDGIKYFIPEGMTGAKLVQFKKNNEEKIKAFINSEES